MDGGLYAKAGEILQELYDVQPQQYRFGVQLALCLRAQGEVAALRTLVERLSTDLRLLARFSRFDLDYLMGWVLGAEGDHEGALQHLLRAGRLEPRRTGLHVQIGEALGALRRWPEAEQAYRRALAIDPLNPHAQLGVAKACLRQNRVDEGIAAALDSIGLRYQNPMAHYILGLGLLRKYQYLRAVAAVQVAVALNPNFERAHRFLARYAHIGEQDMEKSREHWAIVRRIRAERRAHDRGMPEPVAVGLDGLAPEPTREGARVPFDGTPEAMAAQRPETLVDKRGTGRPRRMRHHRHRSAALRHLDDDADARRRGASPAQRRQARRR
jgi:tetratricopeptide (TPR) repeat protein